VRRALSACTNCKERRHHAHLSPSLQPPISIAFHSGLSLLRRAYMTLLRYS
jgi:hypothetical protein